MKCIVITLENRIFRFVQMPDTILMALIPLKMIFIALSGGALKEHLLYHLIEEAFNHIEP